MNKKPTPKSALHFWGVSQIGYQLMQNMDTTFFSYFLTDVALFSVTLSGTVLTATSVVDLIYSIIVGAVVGMLPPMKWGRLRSYHITGRYPDDDNRLQVCYGTQDECIDAALTGRWHGEWRG